MSTNKKPKKTSENVNLHLALMIKSGRYSVGERAALKTLRRGQSKLILMSSNLPAIKRRVIEYYAMLSKTPIHKYSGTNTELGSSCGKLFRVGVLSVTETGDSDIINAMNENI